ncbi:MAG: PEP-CTERM sorting domain-containing protein [Massilia sp.]|nr:PEP-CTERM sorting domain-containing protein [Massilia sp.]
MKASRRASAVAAACLLFAGMATATPVMYQGTFSADDEHVSVPINLAGSGRLTAITSSWALGGFAPVLTLFGGADGYQQNVGSRRTCGAGSGSPDAATGFCWDATLSRALQAGNYLLVLTQDDNLTNGDTLADGFSQDGTPNYTSLNYLGIPNGPLCINVDASQRSCNYAMTVDVALDQVGTVPEPASLALFGLTGLALLRAHRVRRG